MLALLGLMLAFTYAFTLSRADALKKDTNRVLTTPEDGQHERSQTTVFGEVEARKPRGEEVGKRIAGGRRNPRVDVGAMVSEDGDHLGAIERDRQREHRLSLAPEDLGIGAMIEQHSHYLG
jgi:hypothetical protein